MKGANYSDRFTFSEAPTEKETAVIQQGLEDYNREQTNGAYAEPGIGIGLVLKDPQGTVVGGIEASTTYRVMHLDALWVAEAYRKLGFGAELVLAAERIGKAKGCITSQTMSFSFQAPGFYQKIGYEVLGIYDGYPHSITEYVLMKRLQLPNQTPIEKNRMRRDGDAGQFLITETATKEDMRIVHMGLGSSVDEHIGDERDNPGIGIRLVIKDHAGAVIGGLLAWTTIRNMILDYLWLDEGYRGLGLGKALMMEAERMAQESGCIACQTHSFSFQAPEFFQKLGYEAFGISDGYPHPVRGYYLVKKFRGVKGGGHESCV